MTRERLVAADESLNHQVVDTFASVGHADAAWTEKIWAAIHPLESDYQIGFGFGKYTNRGVMDAFAGLARGRDQWVVRSGREIGESPDVISAGPIKYEVLEPYKRIRFALTPTELCDFSFDVTLHASGPAQVESRWPAHHGDGNGLAGDALRYHQSGYAVGWFIHAAERYQIDPGRCVAFRDHSWGVKLGIGSSRQDGAPPGSPRARYRIWSPMHMRREDGSWYGIFVSYLREVGRDGGTEVKFEVTEESTSGSRSTFISIVPRLKFDRDSLRLLGGSIDLVDWESRPRSLTLTPVKKTTAFYISLGGYYGGYEGHALGQWHGAEWSDVVQVLGTDLTENDGKLHQNRDILFRVDDDAGGTGYANVESILTGDLAMFLD
jgi:hypothetical protein